MALTEEQQLMEEKVIKAGYQLKFDHQLHALKKGLIDKNTFLEKRKLNVTDQKASRIRDFVTNFDDANRKYIENDSDGEPVEKNLSWIEAEIGFRNDGLVEREPTGTTYYVDPMQNGDGSSPTNAWTKLYSFVNNARSPGDVVICRRVRGGFNPGDEIFINRYSRYKYHNAGDDDSLTTESNFNSKRDVGYQAVSSGTRGKGTIIAWNQGTDEYHTPGTTGKNRSGVAVTHTGKTMIGDSHGNGADQTLEGISGPTPRAIYMQAQSPDGGSYNTTYNSTARWMDLWSMGASNYVYNVFSLPLLHT